MFSVGMCLVMVFVMRSVITETACMITQTANLRRNVDTSLIARLLSGMENAMMAVIMLHVDMIIWNVKGKPTPSW